MLQSVVIFFCFVHVIYRQLCTNFLGTKIGFCLGCFLLGCFLFTSFTFDASSYVELSDQSVRNFFRIAHT